MTVSTSISALTGVQWTDLDGSGLNSTQTTTQVALVGALNTGSATITNRLNSLDINGSYSYSELIVGISSNTAPYRIGNTNEYAAYATEAQARAAIASFPYVGVFSFYNAQTGGVSWISNYNGSVYVTGNGWTRQQWRNSGYTDVQIITGTEQQWLPTLPTNALTLAQINSALGLSISSTTRLSASAWREIAHKLKAASYLESSKLTTANGGGIKTYGGKWYANGQEVTYLDIIFAVRVNQLFVINNTITDQLTSVQKTNKLIKAANAISSIFSANSPTNSSGSTDYLAGSSSSKIGPQLLQTGITNGLVTAARTSQVDADALLTSLGNGNAVLYTDGNGTLCLATKDHNGTIGHSFYADHTATTLALFGVVANYSKLVSMFPSASSKIFVSSGGDNCYNFKYTTLNQTDCTTITTELKSYTSNLESDNQTAQTQLDQYSNKRTETLDDISTIVKGSTNVLSSIGKNFGALS